MANEYKRGIPSYKDADGNIYGLIVETKENCITDDNGVNLSDKLNNIQKNIDSCAKTEDIPSIEGLATKEYVDNAVKIATEGLSTDTNTTYTLTKSGSTITLTGSDGSITTVEDTDTNTTYSHPSYTARTGVPTTNQTPTFGGTFNITQPVSDETGHITAMNDRTITIPNATATTDSSGLMSAADKALLGTQDISTIADGTITGAIIYLNNLSADLSNISDALDLINRTVI